MSYNTRRAGNYVPPVSNIGQRRPVTFVPSGQSRPPYLPALQGKPPHVNQQQQHQQQAKIQPQNKAPQMKVEQQLPPPQIPPQNAPQVDNAKPVQQINLQEVAEQFISQQQGASTSDQHGLKSEPPQNSDVDIEAPPNKSKPFWMKRAGRISKAEKMRKRNLRLKKMLQPKNALMILYELVGSTTYNLSEGKPGFDDMFRASVLVDGKEHVGSGKSKVSAKTSAAESAIRSIILKKLNTLNHAQSNSKPELQDNEGDTKMEEVAEEEQLSWSHIASFAIHKLFSSWDEDGNIADMFSRSYSSGNISSDSSVRSLTPGQQQLSEQRPAKKLPENALEMNPIMLLNQMHPSAKYEEISKVGNPPHIVFTMQCTVMDQTFMGSGPNKKTARKQAAYAACKHVLNMQYPSNVFEETPFQQVQ